MKSIRDSANRGRNARAPRVGYSARRREAGFASVAFAVATLAVFASCAGKAASPYDENGQIVAAQAELPTVELAVGGARVVAEVARTDEQRRIGLMFRKTLEDGRGMLFVFDRDRRLSFWMANTLLPLSIAYIDSSFVIRDILDMTPLSTSSVPSSVSVRYALEVPQGWFSRAGVSVGDVVVIPEGARTP